MELNDEEKSEKKKIEEEKEGREDLEKLKNAVKVPFPERLNQSPTEDGTPRYWMCSGKLR